MPNTPPAVGQDPWGEDLNSYLAWLESNVGVVETKLDAVESNVSDVESRVDTVEQSVVTDGDKGDIVVSGSGATWMFDTSIVTPAAKTVLDDASTTDMLTTLGAASVASVDAVATGTKTVETVSGTSYAVVAADANKIKRLTAATTSVSLPTTGALSVGQRVEFVCVGGSVSFLAVWDALATAATARDVGSVVTAIRTTATGWTLEGDLNPAAVPTITSISPPDLSKRFAPTQVFTFVGSGFTSGAKVRVNGVVKPTTFQTPTQITAVIDHSGYTLGTTLTVDITQKSGTTATKSMRVADFVVGVGGFPPFAQYHELDPVAHQLTTGTYSGTFVFAPITPNAGGDLYIKWTSGGNPDNLLSSHFAFPQDGDKVLSAVNVGSVSAEAMKALPADTVYTFDIRQRLNAVVTSHTFAQIGYSAPASVDYVPSVFIDTSTVPGSTNTTLTTPGVRHPVPFAFSTLMTGGSAKWLSGAPGAPANLASEICGGGTSAAYWPPYLHVGGATTGYAGTKRGELAWLDGKTVDIEFDPTGVTGNTSLAPWRLSDPQTELVYGMVATLPGVGGNSGVACIQTGLVAWKTSDAPVKMFLRRHPADVQVPHATQTSVYCFDDVANVADGSRTWKPLYKADLTTAWTATEVAAMVNAKITLSRDPSGVLVLTPPSPFDMASWHAAYWASDPAWTRPADGAPVPTGTGWRDGSGNSRDLTVVSGGPLYQASTPTLNNKPAIIFDGVNDYMQLAANFTAIPHPYSMVVVFQLTALKGNLEPIACAGTGFSDPVIGGGSGAYGWFASINGSVTSMGTADTAKHLIVANLKGGVGGASELSLDGALVSNPTGTLSATRWRLGSNSWGACAVNIAFAGFKAGALTTQEQADLLAWSRSFYGTP